MVTYAGTSNVGRSILDVETTLNNIFNRPLGYVEDDIQIPVLTPNVMLFGQPNQIPEEEPTSVKDYDLRKRAKHLRKCKDVLWKRWTTEYLKALRERHNLNQQTKKATLKEKSVNSVFLDAITEKEVEIEMSLLNGNKASGHDYMPPKIVKKISRYIAKPLK